jgi:hypothetical protein
MYETKAEDQPHEHDYLFSRGCGADVCYDCGDHKGLARCFCGWAASGGNGYQELVDMGEQIEDD